MLRPGDQPPDRPLQGEDRYVTGKSGTLGSSHQFLSVNSVSSSIHLSPCKKYYGESLHDPTDTVLYDACNSQIFLTLTAATISENAVSQYEVATFHNGLIL